MTEPNDALAPLLSYLEGKDTPSRAGANRGPIPSHAASTKDLQAAIESAWSQGFDREGGAQLGFRLVKTRKWIGATEVVACLTMMGFNAIVVDVPRESSKSASERILVSGPAPLCHNNYRFTSPVKSFLWRHFGDAAHQDTAGCKQSHASPVMLQLAGHSMVIVGASRPEPDEVQLFALDPAARFAWRARSVSAETGVESYRLKASYVRRIKEAQLVYIDPAKLDLSSSDLSDPTVVAVSRLASSLPPINLPMATLETDHKLSENTAKTLNSFVADVSRSTVTLDEKEKGSKKVEVCRDGQCITVHEAVTSVFQFMQSKDYFCSLPLDPKQTQIECRKIDAIIK